VIVDSLIRIAKRHGANKLEEESRHYLVLYERYLDYLAIDIHTLLEIGVQKGGSLKMWCEYLPEAECIHGVDIKDKCKAVEEHDGRIKVFIGDQSDKVFLNGLGKYDVIIDDGSHCMNDTTNAFECLWPHVNAGGLYVVEDLHTSYWPEFGGGQGYPFTAISMLKRLVEQVNWWAIGHERAGAFRKVVPPSDMAAIHFHRSICFLEKEL
jgi:hypothetical protein